MDIFGGIGINGNTDGNGRDLILLLLFFTQREKADKQKQQQKNTCPMKPWAHFDFFSKRNINKNILSGMKVLCPERKCILLIFGIILFTGLYGLSSCSQQKDISRHRVEKEEARKNKEARKKYEEALKVHEKNQSAATRSMMKETKKESPKNTPLKRSRGKKCK
jgi:hypothetical protein